MGKPEEISEVQSARLNGLAKVLKQGTQLYSVLSLAGSSFDYLSKTLVNLIDRIERANINWPGRFWRNFNCNLMRV